MHRPPSTGKYPPRAAKAATFSAEVIETVRNIGGPVWSSYGSIYRRQPAVRSIVDFLSRNVAQLNPKVFERLGDNDRLEIGQHPLAELLRHPNVETTRFRHLRDTVADLAIYDRAYWEKQRVRGRLAGVVRHAPSHVVVDSVDGRRRYRYVNGSEDREIRRGDLVIFPGYHPDGDELGVSPLETLRQVLLAEQAATQHRAAFWQNSARQGGVIQRPLDAPAWSDEARQRFRADLEAMHTGRANSGRAMVLEEGMEWNSAAFSPKDSEYIDGRRLTYEEVSVAYFGPIVGRSFMEATGAGTESNHRQLYQDVLGPWLRMLQDEIELQLLGEFELLAGSRAGQRVYVEFDLAAKLAGSFEEQSKSLVSAIGVPYMTINEGRARLNLPRVDGDAFDTPVQPLNVMYGGQPAVTVPTQVPGDVPGIASTAPQTKAAPSVPASVLRRRDEVTEKHADALRKFFARQQASIVSTTKANKSVDWDRWDRELKVDLFGIAAASASEAGRRAARQLKGNYDETVTMAWLAEHSRVAAENVNAATREAVEAAEDVNEVFETAIQVRAAQLGASLATSVINWARHEAAQQNPKGDEPRTKTWVNSSPRSRHPEFNGMTAKVGEPFANGALYPGDPSLGTDHVAHCRCVMRID